MVKQLVVVVHGVGVREAGVSTEMLSAALQSPDLPPHSSDDFNLLEPPAYDKGGKARSFPAHLRRFRKTHDDGTVAKERVIADFYWGDIAAVTGGALGAVLAFFRIAMGLGHAIRENARDVFAGTDWWNRQARRVAGMAVLAIHGPVVAINLALLVGVLVTWATPPAHGDKALSALLAVVPAAILMFLAQKAQLKALLAVGMGVITYLATLSLIFAGLSGIASDPDNATQLKLSFDIVVTVLLVAGLGWALLRLTHTYLSRFLGRWLVVIAGLILLIASVASLHEPATFAQRGVDIACNIFRSAPSPDLARALAPTDALSRESCVQSFTEIYRIGLVLYLLMLLSMGFAILGMAFVGGRSFVLYLTKKRQVTDLVTPALGLMLLLWFLLISTVSGLLGFTGLGVAAEVLPQEILITSLRGLLPTLAAVILLVCIAGWVFWRKSSTFRTDKFSAVDYLDDAEGYSARSRLLVSKSMLAVPIFFVLALIGLVVHALGGIDWGLLDRALVNATGVALAALGLIGVVLVVYLRAAFVAGLDIMTDVLAYLNDYSWAHKRLINQRDAKTQGAQAPQYFVDPDAPHLLTRLKDEVLVLLGIRLAPPPADGPKGYWLRARIQDRMAVLVDHLLDSERPDDLILIAHSQGTVIALDLLNTKGRAWRQRVGRIRLVTMGSPARHIYTHYFPASFPDYPSQDNLRKGGGVLDAWVNIFRVDDFVGTHIASDMAQPWPVERPVPANGHTHYWIDRAVIAELKSVLS